MHGPVDDPRAPVGPRIAAAVAAVLVGTSVVGGVFGLFATHGTDTMTAKAEVPAGASAVEVARSTVPAPRVARPHVAEARRRGAGLASRVLAGAWRGARLRVVVVVAGVVATSVGVVATSVFAAASWVVVVPRTGTPCPPRARRPR